MGPYCGRSHEEARESPPLETPGLQSEPLVIQSGFGLMTLEQRGGADTLHRESLSLRDVRLRTHDFQELLTAVKETGAEVIRIAIRILRNRRIRK